jgi:group I intron endonuclease
MANTGFKVAQIGNLPSSSGIYKICCVSNRGFYVGSAFNLNGRLWRHIKELRRGRHTNTRLQRAYDKYGEWSLRFSVVILCSIASLLDEEQKTIDKFYGTPRCFNMAAKAGRPPSHLGRKRSPETCAKIGASHRGQIITDEQRQKISAALIGKPLSEETRRKMSASRNGKNHPLFGKSPSEETRRKISKSLTGYRHSEDTKKKLSQIRKGKPNPHRGHPNPNKGKSWSLARRAVEQSKGGR